MLCLIYDAENNYFLPFFSIKVYMNLYYVSTFSPSDNEKNKLKDAKQYCGVPRLPKINFLLHSLLGERQKYHSKQ